MRNVDPKPGPTKPGLHARAWEAIELVGGAAKAGALCGLTRQAVYLWSKVPGEYLPILSRESGLTADYLRPDLYPTPEAPDTSAEALAKIDTMPTPSAVE